MPKLAKCCWFDDVRLNMVRDRLIICKKRLPLKAVAFNLTPVSF